MKAINCTQCGATLEDVSERSRIITCDYCGARIMVSKEPEVPRTPAYVQPPELKTEQRKLTATTIGLLVAVILLLPLFLVFLTVKTDEKKVESAPYSFSSSPWPSPSVLPIWSDTNTPEKPVPVVNYQPRVSWEGPNDMEHFESPEVDISSVSHLTSEEVEKTVFKNRVVKLRVVINTEGEIDEVETISGHPLLVAAATESAKKSIFNSRSKPTRRVLTYTFRVLKD